MTMFQMTLMALLAGGFTYFCTTIGSGIVFIISQAKRDQKIYMQLALGFSAGIMLAASIFSLIIPALNATENLGIARFIPIMGGFVAGVAFLIILDKTLPHLHALSHEPEGPKSHLGRHTLLFLAITIHNIPEGMAIGVAVASASMGNSLISATAVLALGIGLQNLPEGAAVSMPYYAHGMSKFKAFILGSLSGIVEPISAVAVVLSANAISQYLPWFLSFAAGAMMYVVVEELIPQSHGMNNDDKGTLSVLAGFLLMMFLDVALG